ncbi:MAG: sulfatase-like hydrolase/transferase [Acidobacteria bacterium]|nr:sulfatase-like hydrolase/transferase [Acidobacteriota bacterium]
MRRSSFLFLLGATIVAAIGCDRQVPASSSEEAHLKPTEARQQLLGRLDQIEAHGKSSLHATTVKTLWSRGTTVDRLTLEAPPRGILETAIAIDPSASLLVNGHFELRIGLTDENDEYTEIFERSYPADDSGGWISLSIDLKDRSGPVDLSFHKRHLGEASELLADFEIAATDLVVWRFPRIVPQSLDRPNVILISLDTLRPDHLGLEGYRRNTSPNIDALARNGTYFGACFSQAPWTMPAHYSILSGTLPSTSGSVSPVQSIVVPMPSVPMLAELMRDAGYLTAAFTGGGAVSADLGFDRGFDAYDETDLVDGSDVTTIVSKASEWLRRRRNRSFFLFIHSYEPHEPFTDHRFIDGESPSRDFEANLVAKYDGDISRADEALGELFQLLRSQGLDSNTIVLVTSDHGKEFFERRVPPWESFAEHGHTLYDEILRVPLVMSGPDVPKGMIVTAQIRSIDIAPTILALIGLDGALGMEGKDLTPWMNGQRRDDLPAFAEATTYGPARESLRTGGYKLIRRTGYGQLSHPCCSSFPMTPREELYDLSTDPSEANNLAGSAPAVLGRLRSEISLIGVEAATQAPGGTRDSSSPSSDTINSLRSLGYLQ